MSLVFSCSEAGDINGVDAKNEADGLGLSDTLVDEDSPIASDAASRLMVTGRAAIGSTLEVASSTLDYQWRRDPFPYEGQWQDIAGATSYRYRVQGVDGGHKLSVIEKESGRPSVASEVVDSEVLWSADHSEMSLLDWGLGNEGEITNDSPGCSTETTGDVLFRGGHTMRSTCPMDGSGTRIWRFPEPASQKETFVSWWEYVPEFRDIDSTKFGWSNWAQIKTIEPGGGNIPVWHIGPRSSDRRTLDYWMDWAPQASRYDFRGPEQNDGAEKKSYPLGFKIPIATWYFVEFAWRYSDGADFDGFIKVWINGEKYFDKEKVRTGGNLQDAPGSGVREANNFFSLNCYGQLESPRSMSIYRDEVTISKGRVPYRP